MPVSRRLRLTFAAIREQTLSLFAGTDKLVTHRFQLLDPENTLRNIRVLAAMKRLSPSTPADDHG